MKMDAQDASQGIDTRGPAGGGPVAAATPLRRFLALDAVVTAGNGLIYLVAAGPVGRLLDLSSGFLRAVGLFLVIYGLEVGFLASRKVPSVRWTQVVIELNLAWAAASVAAVVFGWLEPNGTGLAWVLMQAAVVGGFALLQRAGVKTLRAGTDR